MTHSVLECPHCVPPASQERVNMRVRISELEAALRSLVDMETNRYACGATWHATFADARRVLERK